MMKLDSVRLLVCMLKSYAKNQVQCTLAMCQLQFCYKQQTERENRSPCEVQLDKHECD